MRWRIAVLGFAVTVLTLLAQLGLTLEAFNRRGLPLPNAFIFNFAYFTVLANTLSAFVYAGEIWPAARWLGWFRRPNVAGFAVSALLLVMIVAAFVLGRINYPPEYFIWVEYAMHYLAPPLFIFWWAVFRADGGLRFRAVPLWILALLAYLGLILLRGQIVSVYPYPILNPDRIGWNRVLYYVGHIAMIYSGICVAVFAADHLIARLRARLA